MKRIMALLIITAMLFAGCGSEPLNLPVAEYEPEEPETELPPVDEAENEIPEPEPESEDEAELIIEPPIEEDEITYQLSDFDKEWEIMLVSKYADIYYGNSNYLIETAKLREWRLALGDVTLVPEGQINFSDYDVYYGHEPLFENQAGERWILSSFYALYYYVFPNETGYLWFMGSNTRVFQVENVAMLPSEHFMGRDDLFGLWWNHIESAEQLRISFFPTNNRRGTPSDEIEDYYSNLDNRISLINWLKALEFYEEVADHDEFWHDFNSGTVEYCWQIYNPDYFFAYYVKSDEAFVRIIVNYRELNYRLNVVEFPIDDFR